MIREEIIGFFQNLYRENEHWRPQFNPRDQAMLNEEDNLLLQSQLVNRRSKNVCLLVAGDKAPGPDGFTMAFFYTLLGGGEDKCYSSHSEFPWSRLL